MVCVTLFSRGEAASIFFGAGAVVGDAAWGDDAVFGRFVVDAVEGFGVCEESAIVDGAELGDQAVHCEPADIQLIHGGRNRGADALTLPVGVSLGVLAASGAIRGHLGVASFSSFLGTFSSSNRRTRPG